MKYKKAYYKNITHFGYHWGGYWNNLHHFIKKVNQKFLEIACIDEDIEDGSLIFMMEHGFTR